MVATSQEIRRGAVYVLHVEALAQQKKIPLFLIRREKLCLAFISQGGGPGEGIL